MFNMFLHYVLFGLGFLLTVTMLGGMMFVVVLMLDRE